MISVFHTYQNSHCNHHPKTCYCKTLKSYHKCLVIMVVFNNQNHQTASKLLKKLSESSKLETDISE